MNCYECKFKGSVPGSAHSSCNFLKEIVGDKQGASLIELLLSAGTIKLTATDKKTGVEKPMVSLSEHGVKNGWANWPFDFDPIWVEECLLYNEKTN
jgi:hypothetical protein